MTGRILQSVAALVGVWLMFSPAVLGYGGGAASNDRIVGPVAASIAIMAFSEVLRGVRLVNVPLGGWLVLSAFLLPYPGLAAASPIVAGVILAALSIPGADTTHRYGAGWMELVGRR